MGDYYQSSELVDRINWKRIMKMERCSGGHDPVMKGLLKDVIRMCKNLAGSAYVFANLGDCIGFLELVANAGDIEYPEQYDWSDGCAVGLLGEIRKHRGLSMVNSTTV